MIRAKASGIVSVWAVIAILVTGKLNLLAWEIRQVRSIDTGVIGLEHVFVLCVNQDAEVQLRAAVFDERRFTIKVVDNPPGRGMNLVSAAMQVEAVAGVNGGFFSKENEPLGWYVVDGRVIQRGRANRLLTGMVGLRGQSLFIERFHRFRYGRDVRALIQTGPFLVENGQSVIGLNTEHRARRTAVASDGNGLWALISVDNVTLYEAAELLTQKIFGDDFRVDVAINLDGGSSAGFWIRGANQPFYWPEWARVRNFLVVISR
ncbi:MAG: phosphodiester glycosidase family protein [Methylacidiphilales bacterium]|nr:phosphodiester glycosidase family protein [Candidatus Methylacidiphilales bacterium]MDW8348707.1 phosphodiester glycosidase family protein [Verrucomicrobiae bacterium]